MVVAVKEACAQRGRRELTLFTESPRPLPPLKGAAARIAIGVVPHVVAAVEQLELLYRCIRPQPLSLSLPRAPVPASVLGSSLRVPIVSALLGMVAKVNVDHVLVKNVPSSFIEARACRNVKALSVQFRCIVVRPCELEQRAESTRIEEHSALRAPEGSFRNHACTHTWAARAGSAGRSLC